MIKLIDIDRVREEIGDKKAQRLGFLREYTNAMINMARCNTVEGSQELTQCLIEANEILAEAGLVSNR